MDTIKLKEFYIFGSAWKASSFDASTVINTQRFRASDTMGPSHSLFTVR